MNLQKRIKKHFEEVLGQALVDSKLLEDNNPQKLDAAILKLYKPHSQEEVKEWLDNLVHPNLEQDVQKTLSLAASCMASKILKSEADVITPQEVSTVINEGIQEAKDILYRRHDENTLHKLDIADIKAGHKAMHELVHVDVPEAILEEVNNTANRTYFTYPQKLINFSETCIIKYAEGSDIKTNELNSLPDALKFIRENPGKEVSIANEHTPQHEKTETERSI